MNINEKIDNYLFEGQNFEGKKVIITTKSGAKYSGIYHKSSDKSIILSKLGIFTKSGGFISSKSNEKRKFDPSHIDNIEMEK